MNSTEEAIFVVLQKDDQNNEQHVAYMIQSLSNDEIKYSFIEKHSYTLVKAIEKFCDFILNKHTQVKAPLHVVKFLLSRAHLLGKIVHWIAKIQEHDLTITSSNTIKGCDLALHLAQHHEPSDSSEENENALSTLFFIEN